MSSGASITFLPAFDKQLEHFTLRPVSSMNPVLRTLMKEWDDAAVDRAAAFPGQWQFLFFHEYPAHGGDPGRSFFAQALGKPNPQATAPSKLPP
ncbi:MAG: hypothetical protein R3F14_41445 [Polyangiaceae bacterium]